MEPESTKFTEQGVLTLSQEHWELARERASIIAPLAALETIGLLATRRSETPIEWLEKGRRLLLRAKPAKTPPSQSIPVKYF